jgi:hypothetical protein
MTSAWNTSPITASLRVPADPDARVTLPHLTCEPITGMAEAAVLFAAGYAEAARLSLEDAAAREPLSRGPWLMLLDLHRLQDRQDQFDAVNERYRVACPDGPRPLWSSSGTVPSDSLTLAGRISDAEQLRRVFEHAHSRVLVAIDLKELLRIDLALAPKFCAALRLFALKSKRVILTHVSPLHEQLLATIGLHPSVGVLTWPCGLQEPEMTLQSFVRAA